MAVRRFFANWDEPWTNELGVYGLGVSGVSVLITSVVSLATDRSEQATIVKAKDRGNFMRHEVLFVRNHVI